MIPSILSPLETLPLLALSRICEYLDDDDSEKRRSLWAFSLTSRCCCVAAAAQRFCQIQLKIPAPGELESGLRRWTEVLNHDSRHRHVRRLKVLRATVEERRCKKGLQRQDEEAEDDEDEDEDMDNVNWEIRSYFDMHDFCRPSQSPSEGSYGGSMEDHPEAWLSLVRFISQLPALKDLVWACGSHMPQCVLSAIGARGCRLHMHSFRLPSLIQFRDNPQPVDLDDYALATSPSLYSIAVNFLRFETDGEVNYIEEAVMRLVAGMAPSLAHVWPVPARAGDSLKLREAFLLGKPAWGGFFPKTAEADKPFVLGSLQSLVVNNYVSYGIENWNHHTDFTKLRCLTVSWQPERGVALAKMAVRGNFKSLKMLGLSEIEDETEQTQEALTQLLENLNPLQQLRLCGYISNEIFHIVLRRHGGTLRSLSLLPYRDNESQNPLVDFSEAVIQRLAEQCLNLEQLWLWINRTRGDDRETAIYRALSKLPRLRRVFLRLWYSIGPDEDFWDEEIDGEYPLSSISSGEDIPFAYLREAFINSAIDATLALSIFNLISSGGSLRYLKLEVSRKMGRNAPGFGCSLLDSVLRWFNRSWVCKRDARGRVTVQELDKKGTAEAGEEWQYFSKNQLRNWEEIYPAVYKDIWPRRTPEWWKDWKSLPLSNGVA